MLCRAWGIWHVHNNRLWFIRYILRPPTHFLMYFDLNESNRKENLVAVYDDVVQKLYF